jgi:capsular polysaccharide export protein
MPQCDLVSAAPSAPRGRSAEILEATPECGRLRLFGAAPDLAALLPDFVIERGGADPTAAFAAWSGGAAADRARAKAAARGAPFLLLGEGLLRAPRYRRRRAALLSATALLRAGPPSPAALLDPEHVLATRAWETPALLARAATARRALVDSQVGGSWWDAGGELPRGDGLALVCADRATPPGTLRQMLAAARAETSADRIVVLAAQPARLRDVLGAAGGCAVVTQALDPWAAIERAALVYTAGGEIGFLALLAGRPVRCFGAAFYAGWGITRDAAAVPERPFQRSLDEIFAGACLIATRCRDPYRDRPAGFEEIVAILADWRRVERANREVAVCVGMSFWKRRRVADFLRSSAGVPVFRRGVRGALAAANARGGAIAAWTSRLPAGLAEAAAAHGLPLIRVEDGFVRSVGLGSDFMPAASLVFDRSGAYFDPSRKSDLESLLLATEFDPRLVERARRLTAQLVARGITKYNLGEAPLSIGWPPERRRILVPGQVEDDLSVRLGGGEVRGNLDLLGRVRAGNPDAFIVYKPHPDVEAGHRKGTVPDAEARRFADLVVRGVSTAALLADIDELHTLTSLAGFEALLRGRRVVVYGRPFYAGWGLTTDLAGPDRGRRLALEELVAGALILYPRYLDPVTRLPCGPELVIERLADPELWRPGPLVLARRLQGAVVRWWSTLTPKPAGGGW